MRANAACHDYSAMDRLSRSFSGRPVAASIRNHRLECYAYPGIGPPYRVAVTTSAFQHDIETCRNAERCGDLQHGAGLRNIFDSAIELGRLIAQDDRGTFQYALAWCGAPVFHGSLPALTSAFHADWSLSSLASRQCYKNTITSLKSLPTAKPNRCTNDRAVSSC